jgi:hypothetical protein
MLVLPERAVTLSSYSNGPNVQARLGPIHPTIANRSCSVEDSRRCRMFSRQGQESRTRDREPISDSNPHY